MVVFENTHDYVLVGGGLQSGLIALALRHRRPTARIAVVERAPRLGGNHTWCFHSDDLSPDIAAIVEPLVTHRWTGYRTAFPGGTRDLDTAYAAVTSRRFADVVAREVAAGPGCHVLTNTEAEDIGAQSVRLADGRTLTADLVVDARGPSAADANDATCGYQKFVGLEIDTPTPHGLERPILMDACVEQLDGFRFLYVLPLGPRRLLLEDTRFSDSPTLARNVLGQDIYDYAREHGYVIERIVRTESGVLPLPWDGVASVGPDDGPLVAGFQGGWFHPVTGYSFPVAARLADIISAVPATEARDAANELARSVTRQRGYCHRLNKMLFNWFAPEQRYHVLERFYTLPEPVIRRFYALQLTAGDRARILIGRPPRGMSYRAALFGRSP